MTIKSSGSLSMSEINTELGRSNTATNLGNSALRALAGKATGAIKFSDFYGKSHEVVVTLAASNSIVLANSFTAAVWESSVPKRVIIPAGVEIGATNLDYAIATSYTANGQAGNFGGTLTLENRGTISGMGGAANSGVGGSCVMPLFLGRDGNKLIIQNYGTIRAGGGGGGRGGNGGNGTASATVREPTSGYNYSSTAPITTWTWYPVNQNTSPWPWGWRIIWNDTTVIQTVAKGFYSPGQTPPNIPEGTTLVVGSYTYISGPHVTGTGHRVARQSTQTVTTSGGAGGNGGRGQGYDGASTTGANGAAGGTNAGAGGKGGDGGGWGASGATGATGTNGNVSNGAAGAAGGLAGFYITTGANVTLVNSGTVQGRLG